MIIELTPYLRAIATEDQFEEAIGKYAEVYIETTSGWLCHKRLTHGRFVRCKVFGPPLSSAPSTKIKPESTFMPAGKIPKVYLEQILAFYRDVNKLPGRGNLEAKADIVWHPERGYRVAVPTQTVSVASVSYQNDHLQEGEVIVVDTHSHNSMAAFFSGTDNNDDTNSVRYSGVIGKLTDASYESIWRFNNGAIKTEATLKDIFEVSVEKVEYPSEWKDKIQLHTRINYQHPGKHHTRTGLTNLGAGSSDPNWAAGLDTSPVKTPARRGYADIVDMTDEEIAAAYGLYDHLDFPMLGDQSSKKPQSGTSQNGPALLTAKDGKTNGLPIGDVSPRGFATYTRILPQVDLDEVDPVGDGAFEMYDEAMDCITDLATRFPGDKTDEYLLKIIREAADYLSPVAHSKLSHSGL